MISLMSSVSSKLLPPCDTDRIPFRLFVVGDDDWRRLDCRSTLLLSDRDGDGVAFGVLDRTTRGDIVEHLSSACVVLGMKSFDRRSETKMFMYKRNRLLRKKNK